MSELLLDIKDLSIIYSTEDGVVRALNKANLQLHKGESLGLVGETGAGKTTLARGIMRLIPNPPGKITNGEIIQGSSMMRHDAAAAGKKNLHDLSGSDDIAEPRHDCRGPDP